jgi:hypothetical protein
LFSISVSLLAFDGESIALLVSQFASGAAVGRFPAPESVDQSPHVGRVVALQGDFRTLAQGGVPSVLERGDGGSDLSEHGFVADALGGHDVLEPLVVVLERRSEPDSPRSSAHEYGQFLRRFSATIGRQLLERGLIDEIDLRIAPVLARRGDPPVRRPRRRPRPTRAAQQR